MVGRLLKRAAMFTMAVLGAEAAYAVLRPAPRLEQFDPSAEFGDPNLPLLKVAVLGDSSVTAPGVSGPHEIWVSLICSRLAENRHVVLRSFALGGSRAQDVLTEQLEPALEYGPDVVFLSVGANDAIKGVPRRKFIEDLDRIVAAFAATGAMVVQSGVGFLGSIPRLQPPLSQMMERRAVRFDLAHREVAARHGTAVVDQRSDDRLAWHRDRSLWAEDYFHVSAAGHARWAETVWRTVGPLLDGAHGPG
jgi:lysophospholipase L1-like esterase